MHIPTIELSQYHSNTNAYISSAEQGEAGNNAAVGGYGVRRHSVGIVNPASEGNGRDGIGEKFHPEV
jgi:hypothetical protein